MNRRRYIFGGAAILVLLLGLLIFHSLQFKVTGTNPDLGSVSTISPFIDIQFSKALSDKGIDVSSDRTAIIGKEIVNKNILRIYFDNLTLGSKNSLWINTISSTSGKQIKGHKFEFTAKDITFDKMSKAQQQAILSYQDRPSPTKGNPILSHLPYGGLHFELTAEAGEGGALTLNARLLLSAADARSGASAAAEQYKKEVQDYIRSIKLDPAKYTINYEVVQPSIY